MNFIESHYIPIIRLSQCFVVSVPNELQDRAATELKQAVANRLSKESGIRGLIIDVGSLGLVDSFVAKVLAETASIARSYGTRAVLCGIRPAVATTLVELGVDLAGVETAMHLEGALRKLRMRVVVDD